MRFFLLASLTFILSACVSQDFKTYERYIASKNIPAPTLDQFPHCHGYGCPSHYLVELHAKEWKQIDRLFRPASKNPQQERARIAKAIGAFETIVGKMTGTEVDYRGTFLKMGRGQLDCVDESTNTTIYLDLLRQRGHLKFHEIQQPQIRTPFTGGGGRWVHQSAVIHERESGVDYAVDSWFEHNGKPAHIVKLSDWRSGWRPERQEGEE